MAKNEIVIIISAVDKASGAFKKVDGSLSSLQKAGIAAAVAVTAIATAMGLVIKKAGKFVFDVTKSAAEVEQLAGVNTILAKNAGIADEAVREQVKGIREQGIEAAVAERAVGQFLQAELDLSKATDLVKVAQDAAVISLSNSTDTYDSLIHGIITLNIETLRNAGITIDTTSALEKHADQIGKSVSELSSLEKQQAFLNAVLDQGVKIQGAYDEAMKNPVKQLGSMERLIDDLKVAMGEEFIGVFSTVISKLSEFVKWLIEAVKEGGVLRPVLELLAEYAELGAKRFGEFTDTLMAADYSNAVDNIKKVVEVVEGLIKVLKIAHEFYLIVSGQKLGQIGSGIFGGGKEPARAGGGVVSAGKTYRVGERGEELFTPRVSGVITPNSQIRGGGQSLALTVNITSAVNLADRNYAERELMPFIEAGVRQLMARGAA